MADEQLSPMQIDRFRRLMWPWINDVLRVARYLARHDADADDLAQETMMKAARFIDQYRQETNAKAWLLAILRNTHISRARREARHTGHVSLDSAPAMQIADPGAAPGKFELDDNVWQQGDSPQELLNRFEDQAVIDALKSLPDEIRWTLLLVDVESLDQTQAAEVLEVPVGTIKSRAHRGRAMLRQRLASVAAQRGWLAQRPAAEPGQYQ